MRLIAAAELARTQAAGLRAGQAFARAYVRAKQAQGVADFNDLIAWTRRLFEQPGMGDWVRYKLDQRTDHILVDEAQDTNADQWAIVDALAGEYFSGNAEAENRWRTLFMVGDYKQAIFGFQGTDPKEYEQFRAKISERAALLLDSAGEAEVRAREFRDLSIDASFRSSPPVLEVVDALIGDIGFREMGLSDPPNPHQPFHASRPGGSSCGRPTKAKARRKWKRARKAGSTIRRVSMPTLSPGRSSGGWRKRRSWRPRSSRFALATS
jgi:ATP-dependent helicase/nuclease subunit A